MRISRTEHLQALWDALGDEFIEAEIVFRPFDGWYRVTDEPRHIGDDGERIGLNWREAEKYIALITPAKAQTDYTRALVTVYP